MLMNFIKGLLLKEYKLLIIALLLVGTSSQSHSISCNQLLIMKKNFIQDIMVEPMNQTAPTSAREILRLAARILPEKESFKKLQTQYSNAIYIESERTKAFLILAEAFLKPDDKSAKLLDTVYQHTSEADSVLTLASFVLSKSLPSLIKLKSEVSLDDEIASAYLAIAIMSSHLKTKQIIEIYKNTTGQDEIFRAVTVLASVLSKQSTTQIFDRYLRRSLIHEKEADALLLIALFRPEVL